MKLLISNLVIKANEAIEDLDKRISDAEEAFEAWNWHPETGELLVELQDAHRKQDRNAVGEIAHQLGDMASVWKTDRRIEKKCADLKTLRRQIIATRTALNAADGDAVNYNPASGYGSESYGYGQILNYVPMAGADADDDI